MNIHMKIYNLYSSCSQLFIHEGLVIRVMVKDLVRTRDYTTKFTVIKTTLNAVALKMQVK